MYVDLIYIVGRGQITYLVFMIYEERLSGARRKEVIWRRRDGEGVASHGTVFYCKSSANMLKVTTKEKQYEVV